MSDPLPIQPFTQPVRGSVELPGSKSITNRALMLAALCRKPITLTGALFSEDTEIMVNALQQLGFGVEVDPAAQSIRVEGQGGLIPQPEAQLEVGNAGTAARFLTALLCLRKGGHYQLDGAAAMHRRPMRGLLDALGQHGAATVTYEGEAGYFPFTLETKGLPGGILEVDAASSSQILSALLMVAPYSRGETLIVRLKGSTVSHPFVAMTLAMMEQFGQNPKVGAGSGPFKFQQGAYELPHATYPVEPDATAASYFMALPWVVGGELALAHTAPIKLQGDIRFLDILGQLGGCFDSQGDALLIHYPDRRCAGFEQNFNAISDTFLTLAALAPLMQSPLTITGIGHTRHQETDRIAAMATELSRLGQEVEQGEDFLTVHPDLEKMRQLSREAPVAIKTYHDHRVAMSFGILGCYDLHGDARPWLALHNPGCCAKTFPHFFELLTRLQEQSQTGSC